MAGITATTDLVKLKKIFNDPASLLLSNTSYDLASGTSEKPLALTFDYKFPVTVDTLKVNQDDPTVNHYKIIGLSGDWATSAKLGDVSIQLTVASIADEALKACFGEDAVSALTNIKIGDGTYTGSGLNMRKHKIEGTLAIVASNGTDVMLIPGTALYAKLLWDNAETEPFAIQISGGIEVNEEKPSIAWITKSK